MYGNYVLLKCLETVDKQKMEFIIPPVEDNVTNIINNNIKKV
jgi:hypothetical protein